MPGNTLFDPKEVEDFIENGGVSHNTIHEHFASFEDEDGKYWKKVLGETSKNHRLDSEDLRKGGLIIYEPNAYNPGYNGGEYFEL